jgi:hypothetical protein
MVIKFGGLPKLTPNYELNVEEAHQIFAGLGIFCLIPLKANKKKVPQNGYGQLLMDLIIRQNQDIPASGLKLWQLWNPLPC